MSAALYIKLAREADFSAEVNGQVLSSASDVLDRLAAQLGVMPLLEFFSTDPENLPEEAEGIEVTWKEEWFQASDGLATVRALLSYLEDHSVNGINQARVIDDLKEFEEVLQQADQQGIAWHLEVDY